MKLFLLLLSVLSLSSCGILTLLYYDGPFVIDGIETPTPSRECGKLYKYHTNQILSLCSETKYSIGDTLYLRKK